jgi:hypothetical protein
MRRDALGLFSFRNLLNMLCRKRRVQEGCGCGRQSHGGQLFFCGEDLQPGDMFQLIDGAGSGQDTSGDGQATELLHI